tara:strand:- start:385 stop:1266 length:882 start_codon:yes stop_codon:yes gene_type:complete
MTYLKNNTMWEKNGDEFEVHNDARGNFIVEGHSGWKTYVDESPCTPHIMEHLFVKKRMSKEIKWHGLDDIRFTKQDHEVFKAWPNADKISYAFNSRGFRDEDWPETIEEMRDSIWMIGDSFTMGMGVAYEDSYKVQMEKRTGKRVIDVSLDGTNPNWRRRIALKIMREINPKVIFVHWGYIWRYKRKYRTLAQEVRDTIFRNQEESAIEGFIQTHKRTWDEPFNGTLYHNFLPKFAGQDKSAKYIFSKIQEYTGPDNPYITWDHEQLDTGRDGWHWGTKTINKYVENNLKKLA